MTKYNIICINCFKKGHTFKYCNYPITSYGILAYKKDLKNNTDFLLVQRKDTMGYIDFIRGKYNNNDQEILRILLGEMTINEKYRILTLSFDKLWQELWLNKNSRVFKHDYESAKKKYEHLDILNLVIDNLDNSKWKEQEFSIPKGRRNNSESVKDCAIREFCEETGYTINDINIKNNMKYIEEFFIGSNGIYYKHVYYIAEIKTDKVPEIDYTNVLQAGEIKALKWSNYKDTMNTFRNYEVTKRAIIHKVNNLIKNKLI